MESLHKALKGLPETAITTGTATLASGVASYALLAPASVPLPLVDVELDQRVLLPLMVAGSSFATNSFKNQILPMITDRPEAPMAIYIVKPAITGGFAAAAVFLVNGLSFDSSLLYPFLIGAGAEVAGQYVANGVKDSIGNALF